MSHPWCKSRHIHPRVLMIFCRNISFFWTQSLLQTNVTIAFEFCSKIQILPYIITWNVRWSSSSVVWSSKPPTNTRLGMASCGAVIEVSMIAATLFHFANYQSVICSATFPAKNKAADTELFTFFFSFQQSKFGIDASKSKQTCDHTATNALFSCSEHFRTQVLH